MLSIDRIGMPPALLAALKHLASLHNPAYYEKERLRLSTWKTPRFQRCYGESLDRLLLPRGLREAAGSWSGTSRTISSRATRCDCSRTTLNQSATS
jgi:hypothetical protein